MRILVDANLSPRVAEALRKAGYDATHVRDRGLLRASDEQILAHAQEDGQVIGRHRLYGDAGAPRPDESVAGAAPFSRSFEPRSTS